MYNVFVKQDSNSHVWLLKYSNLSLLEAVTKTQQVNNIYGKGFAKMLKIK